MALHWRRLTVQEFKYFECEPKHGVLVDPRTVQVLQAEASTTTPSGNTSGNGYLSIDATDK